MTLRNTPFREGGIACNGFCIDERPAVEKVAALEHGENRNAGISDFSSGFAFEGTFGLTPSGRRRP